jgi:hypothetical protein
MNPPEGVTPEPSPTLYGHAMGRDGAPGVDRETAEWLLAGAAGRPAEPDTRRLAHLLALAAAPARPGELAGEEAAVAAFHRPGPAPFRPRAGRRALLAKLLTVKVAALLAASTLGGVAVAAAAGRLPELPGVAGIRARDTPPAPPPAVPLPPTTNAGRPAVPQPAAPPAAPDPSPSSGPTLADLCHAAAADHGANLDQPRFAPLVSVAGGPEKRRIRSYCTGLLGPERSRGPKSRRTPSETDSSDLDSKLHPSQSPGSPPPRLNLLPSQSPDHESVPPI